MASEKHQSVQIKRALLPHGLNTITLLQVLNTVTLLHVLNTVTLLQVLNTVTQTLVCFNHTM